MPETNGTEIIRKHIIFIGRVQGVGFRWRAQMTAESLGVSGWVRNLYDGSVEMEAEGREEAIDALVLALDQSSYVRIDEMKVRRIPPEGGYGFHIR